MSLFERTAKQLAPQNYLGAREIVAFGGRAANDNGPASSQATRSRPDRWWVLPAVAFSGGLTAALIVSGLGEWLGFAG